MTSLFFFIFVAVLVMNCLAVVFRCGGWWLDMMAVSFNCRPFQLIGMVPSSVRGALESIRFERCLSTLGLSMQMNDRSIRTVPFHFRPVDEDVLVWIDRSMRPHSRPVEPLEDESIVRMVSRHCMPVGNCGSLCLVVWRVQRMDVCSSYEFRECTTVESPNGRWIDRCKGKALEKYVCKEHNLVRLWFVEICVFQALVVPFFD